MARPTAEFKETGPPERAISKKYDIPGTTLERRLKENLEKVGPKPVSMEGDEVEPKDCIKGAYIFILSNILTFRVTI